MKKNSNGTDLNSNRILAALSASASKEIIPKLEKFELNFTENIYEIGDVIKYAYFPISGIISLLSAVGENSTLEVGIVGKEGVVGLPLYLGVKTSNNRALVQGAGSAFRMTASDFLDECKCDKELPRILARFTHSLITQISQSATCNRFHPIESRLARWLLMTHDRMQSNEFRITQSFLSNMLGVRREAVNHSASSLQSKGLISYSRGKLTMIDRKGLEENACGCYLIIRDEERSFPLSPISLN